MPGSFPRLFLAQESASPGELYDIIVPLPDEPISPLFFYSAVALLVIIGLAVLISYLLRRRKPDSGSESPGAKANRRLQELSQSHDEMAPNQFSLALSETLKDFLSATFADPVRFETTQEFLSRISRTGTAMPPAAQQELSDFLIAAEEVKFGNIPDAAHRTEALLHRAKSVVSLCRSVSSGGQRIT